MWYTNLDTTKRHQDFDLYKRYTPKEYPKYDNYNAIEVSKVSNQFEIIDINPHFFTIIEKGLPKPSQLKIRGRNDPYARVLIKNKKLKK